MNHAAKPPDGLDANDMNVNPGGQQPHMRPTTSEKQMLVERGVWWHGMVQATMVTALQQFPDFSPKTDQDRARVTEMMAGRGHMALLGVKYHAELAHIERKWMHIKRLVCAELDGKYGKLEALLRKAWPKYTVHDARMSARHCRETMRAYEALGDAASLELLQEEEKKQKSHRCVVDSADGLLKAKANIALSEKEKKTG